MGMGFLRMTDEAVKHCRERLVGGVSLKYDQVRSRVSQIQSILQYVQLCVTLRYLLPLTKNTAKMDVEANAVKSVLTDYMQKASQSLSNSLVQKVIG